MDFFNSILEFRNDRAWGLSLIALTTAIHAMGVVMMAIVGLEIRVRLESRNLGLRHVILIVIGVGDALAMPSKSKVLRASRSIRVTVTTSPWPACPASC